VYEWGDIGSEELKKDVSIVNGLVGSSLLPGAEEVYNSKTQTWDKIPNHRSPILNFGGWTNGVAATTDPKVQAAAMDFCAYMGSIEISKKLAIEPDSGVNPGRYSQLGDVAGWVQYGLKESDTVPYLNAIRDTYIHPNVVVDLRVPGGSEYTDAVGIAVAKALAGEAKPQEAMDEAAAKWEEITDRLGRDSQKKAYVESMTLAKSS
jgi:multiple sugar transport system substrate-binding protein